MMLKKHLSSIEKRKKNKMKWGVFDTRYFRVPA